MTTKQILTIFIFSLFTIVGHLAVALAQPESGCSRALHECIEDSVKFADRNSQTA